MGWAYSAVIGGQVDNFQPIRQLIQLYKLFAVAMCRAKKQYIYLVKWQFGCKYQCCFANQSAVYIGYRIACIAGAVYKCDFYIRMMNQNPQQFSGGISCATYYACFYFYHKSFTTLVFSKINDCSILFRSLNLNTLSFLSIFFVIYFTSS